MILFTVVMVVDIFRFGTNMRKYVDVFHKDGKADWPADLCGLVSCERVDLLRALLIADRSLANGKDGPAARRSLRMAQASSTAQSWCVRKLSAKHKRPSSGRRLAPSSLTRNRPLQLDPTVAPCRGAGRRDWPARRARPLR
jgi:hypothetical protein